MSFKDWVFGKTSDKKLLQNGCALVVIVRMDTSSFQEFTSLFRMGKSFAIDGSPEFREKKYDLSVKANSRSKILPF